MPPCAVAVLERRAGPGREIAVARAVDEDAADHRGAAGFRLHDQRADGVVARPSRRRRRARGTGFRRHGRAGDRRPRICRPRCRRPAPRSCRTTTCGAFRPPSRSMRASSSSAMPCTTWRMLAVHIGVQPAEIGDAGRGAHAAEEAVALDQQRLAAHAPQPMRPRRCRPARRRARPRRIRRAPAGRVPARGWISPVIAA